MVQNTLKNSLAVSYKHLPYNPGNPPLGIYPRKMKTYVHKKFVQMFTAVLFVIAQN